MRFPRVKSEPIAHADECRPEAERAPPLAAERQLERHRNVRREPQRARVRAFGTQSLLQLEKDVDTICAIGRCELERRHDVLALECALTVDRQRRVELRTAA